VFSISRRVAIKRRNNLGISVCEIWAAGGREFFEWDLKGNPVLYRQYSFCARCIEGLAKNINKELVDLT